MFDWLRSLGLERYIGVFERAEVDAETIHNLTEDDLTELGLPVGPRRKILSALRAEKERLEPTPDGHTSRAERRHVTVMFADLVGSTEIATRIDPEAMGALLADYQQVVAEEIERYGGYVAKYLGDGVMAYFGWPRAQEDAAERSLRAGLGVKAAVSEIKTPDSSALHVRVGIATGNVVIGDIIGSGSAKEETIAGDTPHLAARLQAAAQPDDVLISAATHRLVGALFECRCAGSFVLKGFSEPVTAWCVECEAVDLNRFAAVRAVRGGLVGREREFGVLLEGWRKAREGQGGAFVISGDAGIGKSRLAEALCSADTGTAWSVRLQCSAFHSTNALFPVARYIEQSAGFTAGDSPETKRRRLGDLFSRVSDSDALVPLASEMLSLTDATTQLDLTPAQRKAALIGGLATWLAEMSERRPVLLVFEDAHWSDATTLEWVTRLVASVANLHQQIVVTARPSFASPWGGREQVTHMNLARLDTAACERIVMAILPESLRHQDVVERIVSNSDGNPLFLEELALGASAATSGTLVPDTLQDALMARLDQLSTGKAVAQRASVLGRRFSRDLLGVVSSLTGPALDAELSTLVAAEILYPVGGADHEAYEFKHALVRDAAYESLLLAERRRLHGDVARALEAHFTEIVENQPELLAHHFAEAEDAPKAVVYFERTGDRAVARSAYAEAIESFNAGLSQLAHFAAGPEKDRAELQLLLKLGTPLNIMRGPNHPDVGAAYQRAAEIAHALDDQLRLFQAVWGLWLHFNVARELDSARAYAEELVALSERLGDENYALEAVHCRWSTAFFRGEYSLAALDVARGISLYQADRHHHLTEIFGGHDPGVCAHGTYGICIALLGRPAEGRLMIERGIALADSLNHPYSVAHAFFLATLYSSCTGDIEGVRLNAPRLLAVASKFSFAPYVATGSFMSKISRAGASEKLDQVEPDFTAARKLTPLPTIMCALMADQLLDAGRPQEALGIADGMIDELKLPNVGNYVSELHRVRAEALHALQHNDAASLALDRAVTIAREQGARLLELRALCTRLRFGEASARRDLAACVAAWPNSETCADLDAATSLLASHKARIRK